jgi:hypothetical protein
MFHRIKLAFLVLVLASSAIAQPAPDVRAYGMACYSDAQLDRLFQWIDAHPQLHPTYKQAYKQYFYQANEQAKQQIQQAHLARQWQNRPQNMPSQPNAGWNGNGGGGAPVRPRMRMCYQCNGTGTEDYTAFANPYRDDYVASNYRYTSPTCGGMGMVQQ